MAKLNQSARSTASKCPVAALLLMLNKWNDGSVVPLALNLYLQSNDKENLEIVTQL